MQLFFKQTLLGLQRQRRVTKEQQCHSCLVHHRPSPTTGLVLPHLQEFQTSWCPNPSVSTAGDCSALPWGTVNPGVGGTATPGGQRPALWALVQLLEVVAAPELGSQQLPNPAWEAPRVAALSAFLRTPNTEAAGCSRDGQVSAGWGWCCQVSPGDGSTR